MRLIYAAINRLFRHTNRTLRKSVKNLQQFVLRRADILTLRTTLSPREAVERLRTYIEPPGISVRQFLPTHFLFVGEVRDNYFTSRR